MKDSLYLIDQERYFERKKNNLLKGYAPGFILKFAIDSIAPVSAKLTPGPSFTGLMGSGAFIPFNPLLLQAIRSPVAQSCQFVYNYFLQISSLL